MTDSFELGQKNIPLQVFKHRYSLSDYSDREKKGKGTWMEEGIGRGKNIWIPFTSLGLRCVCKINQVAFSKMKRIHQL